MFGEIWEYSPEKTTHLDLQSSLPIVCIVSSLW